MDGDFSAEHIRTEMKQGLEALAEDRILAKKEKERVTDTNCCQSLLSILLQCWLCRLDWSSTKQYLQLSSISKIWTRAHLFQYQHQALASSPFLVSRFEKSDSAQFNSLFFSEVLIEDSDG